MTRAKQRTLSSASRSARSASSMRASTRCSTRLQERVGINALLIGTISWLGLKVGRRISHALEGWPDHGVPAPYSMEGGSYIKVRPGILLATPSSGISPPRDPEMGGRDILELVIPKAKARGHEGHPRVHGAACSSMPATAPRRPSRSRTCRNAWRSIVLGRYAGEPCTSNPDYRRWWHGIIEEHVRNYDIDGIMWCNERNSPARPHDAGSGARLLLSALPPRGAGARHRRRARDASLSRRSGTSSSAPRRGETFVDGAFIEFLRVLLRNPEVLLWERMWLERYKDLDRELYGIVKWCNPALSFGLNVWNRNHFNPIRKAQWSWEEQTDYADWVKPITYQHQAGEVFDKEMGFFGEIDPARLHQAGVRARDVQACSASNEAPIDEVIQTGMDPDTYVYGQCADAVRGCKGKAAVYMGIGVDAPRVRGRPGGLHAGHRLSQRPRHLSGGRRGDRLLAELRRHEPLEPRRRRPGAGGTRPQGAAVRRSPPSDPVLNNRRRASSMPEQAPWRFQKIIRPMFEYEPGHHLLRGRVLTCVGDEVIEDGIVEIEGSTIKAVGPAIEFGSARRGRDRHRRNDPARPDPKPRPPRLGRHSRSRRAVDERPARDQRLQVRRQHADQPARGRHDLPRPRHEQDQSFRQAGRRAGHLSRTPAPRLRRGDHPDRRPHLLVLPRGERRRTRCAAPSASRCAAAPTSSRSWPATTRWNSPTRSSRPSSTRPIATA